MSEWAVSWWPTGLGVSGDVPVPFARTRASLEDATRSAVSLIEAGGLDWVKVFKADDECDVRLRWSKAGGYECLSQTASEIVADLAVRYVSAS